ncbi:MAG: hypothetical protein ABIO76_05555, partial [Ginsengibacter sp.]
MKRILLPKIYALLLYILLLNFGNATAQLTISGTVYDSTKLYVVPAVNVSSTSGLTTVTDSLGAYHINVSKIDSISFLYKGKSTVKFPVETMDNYNSFDISLRI